MSEPTIFEILKENPEVATTTVLLIRGTIKELTVMYGGGVKLTLDQILELLESIEETIEEETK